VPFYVRFAEQRMEAGPDLPRVWRLHLYVAFKRTGVTMRIINGGPESIWMTLAERRRPLQRPVEGARPMEAVAVIY